MRKCAAWLLASAAVCAFAAESLSSAPDPVAALPRIRAHIAGSLTHLPNYTCEEKITRYEQWRSDQHERLMDRIRLEVAYVGGRELFGWPGMTRFEDKPLEKLIGGTTGTGAFASLPVQVFGSQLPTFQFKPEEPAGRLRYEYQFPLVPNGFMVGVGDRHGNVGFHGSFWVNSANHHLERLELQADQIPSHVPLSDIRLNVDYQVVQLEEKEYVVPKTAEQIMVTTNGFVTRNITTFSRCHQFRGESVIRFDDAETTAWSAPSQVVDLPDRLNLDAALGVELRTTEPAIGDPVEATVLRDVRRGREVLLPKGAKLIGRVTRLQFVDGTKPFYGIAILFHSARFGRTEARLLTRTMSVFGNIQVSSRPNRWGPAAGNNAQADRLQDSIFFVPGRHLYIPRGTRFSLTTVKETL